MIQTETITSTITLTEKELIDIVREKLNLKKGNTEVVCNFQMNEEDECTDSFFSFIVENRT